MGMSKYTRFKLKAHDRGEDRHNKGVSLLKKQSRLDHEHQVALEMSKRQRAARIKARRECEKRRAQRNQALPVEKITQSLPKPQVTRQFPVKVKMERVPVTADRTYRIRRLDEGEAVEIQVTVQSVLRRRPM